jgi:hypothetical protein
VRDGEVVQGASLAIPPADVQARHLICQEHQVYATFPQALCPYCARAERGRTLLDPKAGAEAASDGWPIEALRGEPKVTAETVAGEIQEDFLPFDNETLPLDAPVRDMAEATAGAVVPAEPAVPMPLPVALFGGDAAEATAANATGPAAAVPIIALVLRLPRAVSVAEGHVYAVALGRREGTRKLPARVDLMQSDGTTIDVASLEPARTTRKRTHDADAESAAIALMARPDGATSQELQAALRWSYRPYRSHLLPVAERAGMTLVDVVVAEKEPRRFRVDKKAA